MQLPNKAVQLPRLEQVQRMVNAINSAPRSDQQNTWSPAELQVLHRFYNQGRKRIRQELLKLGYRRSVNAVSMQYKKFTQQLTQIARQQNVQREVNAEQSRLSAADSAQYPADDADRLVAGAADQDGDPGTDDGPIAARTGRGDDTQRITQGPGGKLGHVEPGDAGAAAVA